jgi:hypothetical protein
LEKLLEPALTESPASPSCVFGLSILEPTDDCPLLRPELRIASVSAETVHERRALLVLLTLEDGESWGVESSMVPIGRAQGVGGAIAG